MATKTRERLIRRPEVLKLTGLSTTEIYRRIDAGTFPRPIKLGKRAVAWPESAINEWVTRIIEQGGVA